MKKSLIHELSFRFALDIIKLYKQLLDKREFIISRQLLKSGTSIGANVEEASAAQSKRDFLSKMSVASKEARETRYWLLLLRDGNLVDIDVRSYVNAIDGIINILTRIVKSTKLSLELST